MIRLDPKLMIAFAVIAQERSFTRAAERLRVAQPWLSARFAKLESLLGFRLLDRTTRSVTLTDRGATLLPVAEEMLRVSQQADRLSLQIGRTERQVLRIGAAPYTKVIRRRHELLSPVLLPAKTFTAQTLGWSSRSAGPFPCSPSWTRARSIFHS